MSEIKKYRCNVCEIDLRSWARDEIDGHTIRYLQPQYAGPMTFSEIQYASEGSCHLCTNCFAGLKDLFQQMSPIGDKS